MKQKRMIINEVLDDMAPYQFEVSLKSLQEKIKEWIDEYGEDATLDWNSNFHYSYDHNPSPRFHVRKNREENDKEFADRISAEEMRERQREEEERAEFKRLQDKFNKG